MNGEGPSYIYGMDKYSGCNIVDSVVTRREQVKIKKHRFRGWLIRMGVAAAIIGVMCFFVYAPIPGLKTARDGMKRVFCYDVFGRTEFGTSPAITRLFK
ncbi:MAG: hypothetical protein K2M48_01330 [Clostridiales bacterium]|nr:hypothetical protein [Clostridiales bacterium]